MTFGEGSWWILSLPGKAAGRGVGCAERGSAALGHGGADESRRFPLAKPGTRAGTAGTFRPGVQGEPAAGD